MCVGLPNIADMGTGCVGLGMILRGMLTTGVIGIGIVRLLGEAERDDRYDRDRDDRLR